MHQSVLNSPTIQFDVDQAKLFQQYQQQQQHQQEQMQMLIQQQSVSIASTPTKEHVDPLSFVQPTQLPDASTQQTSMPQSISNAVPPLQVVLPQIPSNAMVSPQISANTLVLDNLTYSDALKLPPEVVVPIVSQSSEVISNASVPVKPVVPPNQTQNVRKISRFQVSIVDPILTTNSDNSNVNQTIQTTVSSSMAQPIQSTESPEQIEKLMHNIPINNPVNTISTASTTVNFSQIQPNFQPNVFHHQPVDTSGNAQQISTHAGTNTGNSIQTNAGIQIPQAGSILSGK